MITVIIEGTKDLSNTLRSLNSNATGEFRVFIADETIRDHVFWKYEKADFVEPGILRKYGKRSDLYWVIPSGCLVLCSAWDERLNRCIQDTDSTYCLIPANANRYPVTNKQRNVGKWNGEQVIVPILGITEV